MSQQQVEHNEAESCYELATPEGTALAAYQIKGDVIAFTHTEVPEAMEGQGIGGALIAGALADVRRRGLVALPLCSFVRHYVETHPEVQDLLAQR
ncbi:MAG TPA: GNAT family N-acetyltransferase [Sphingomonadaceae bacterium]|jgi:predicted GNAT family acetyltransferase|nr:GNAT family N-acetyltransferase [Sphingomonadaceae bacterium]